MKTATITEAKNGLSALLDQVRAGESIILTDRGVPIARIEPVTRLDDVSGRLQRLVRAGVVRPASADPPLDLLRTPGPKVRGGASAVEAVLEERREGR